MKVEFAAIFVKDLKKITRNDVLSKFREIVLEFEKTDNLFNIEVIKKLAGTKNAYRIRI